jgi:hypothetical protein
MSSTGTKPELEKPVTAAPETTQPADHLFEQEAQLEESGVSFRLIAIIAVIVAIGVGIGYFFVHQQRDLTVQDATPVVTAVLQARGPATISFHTGHIEPSIAEKPHDPHYRLLDKAGILTTKEDKKGGIFSSLTPDGQRVLNALNAKQSKNTDGTVTYTVPLAAREVVTVNSVTMAGPNAAHVEFTWKWKPNVLGQKFDASGDLVQKFNSWDRATLIKDYGVDFFKDTKKSTVYLVRGDNGWKVGQEE